ncbi:hypothetical protein ACSBR2_005600 [Camellia fascicularis]
MKLLSWNIGGLGKSVKKSRIKKLSKDRLIDIVFFQETKKAVVSNNVVRGLWGSKKMEYMSVDLEGTVGGLLCIWDSDYRRELYAWELLEESRLVNVLSSSPPLCLDDVDCQVWANGSFSVSALYSFSSSLLGPQLRIGKFVWYNALPPKVLFFGWLAWKNRIKSAEFLHKIGILSSNASSLCPFCSTKVETVVHVLLHCPFSVFIWSLVIHVWAFNWCIQGSVEGLFNWWMGGKFKRLEKKIWKAIPLVALWSLWKHRNECVFSMSQPNSLGLCELIKTRTVLWLKASTKDFPFLVDDYMFKLLLCFGKVLVDLILLLLLIANGWIASGWFANGLLSCGCNLVVYAYFATSFVLDVFCLLVSHQLELELKLKLELAPNSSLLIIVLTDTLTQSQQISVGQTLISSGQTFELGFFIPSNSSKQYVGIWHKNIPIHDRKVEWVANRENPLKVKANDFASSSLTIGKDGNLRLLDGMNNTVWLANVSVHSNNSIAVLSIRGNLTLKDSVSGSTLWESFNYPCDTFLPGMMLGMKTKTGEKRFLSS